ncbi:hypothetical protein PV370_04745 [Streptomyces sp. NE06-03C]|nr:hypothetical protein [Streptomyces sp. NE06-03C]MDX2917305.1 hypothetical protein [Streptomyces sp. NE06-03C]
MIRIRPTAARRRDFARWAVAQTPKIRTVSPQDFAVPAALFVEAPEEVLIGALVDGTRYVSPVEDAARGAQPPARLLDCGTCYEENGEEVHPHPECPLTPEARPELLGVATAEGFLTSTPGDPLPEVPAEAYGPDSTPLPAPDPADAPSETPEGVFPCSGCDREFTTQRGRDTHQRQKHPED